MPTSPDWNARLRPAFDLSKIHSVASLFISRIDTEVDHRLQAAGHPELAGRAGVANAIVAYGAFTEVFTDARFARLAAQGANAQRPPVGLHRHQEPGLLRHPVRLQPGRARCGEHHAGKDDAGLR